MIFSDPIYLLLLIPTLAWALWLARKMHGMQKSRKRIAIAVRVVVLFLLVFALAGVQIVRENQGMATVYVLDKSASMTDDASRDAQQFIAKSLEARGQNDQAGLVVFGKDPVIDTDTGSLRSLGKIYASPDNSSTDIASAIRLASAMPPEGASKRLVLLTDGNETSGDAAQAAMVAQAENVQIDIAPVTPASHLRGEALIDHIDTPSEVTKGEPFEIKVVAQSTGPATGTLHVDRDGQPVADIPVQLEAGSNSIAVSQTAPGPGFYKYRATLEVDHDTDPRNNTGIGFVNVKGRPRVLLVEGALGTGAALEDALRGHDIDVTRTGASGLPARPEDLQSYDSLILSDYPADGMTDGQMAMIQTAVQSSGLGFGMIGGENSFLSGGYYATPIADALPVDLDVRQRKVFPSTTIEIVIDTSGSMGMMEDGVEKVKIAASAAAAMVRMMSPNDTVGVAGSTDDIRFVAPLQKAVNKEAIANEIGKLDVGGGGIYIEPSLEFADKTLTPVTTKVRHLILESDGDDAEQQEGAMDVARRMVAKGMTVSVIAIGDGKDVGFLKALAAVGHGYFYLASQAHDLQRLVTQDSSIMSRSAIEEGAFLPKVDPGDEVLRGLNLTSMPPLYAYDLTSDRPLARNPMRTGKDDPLLAYWQYGLGTSMAFTSDAQPKWARQWMGWPDFNSFWAQAIRATLRQSSSDNIQMSTRREGGKGVVEMNAFDPQGNPMNGLDAKVNAVAPDGKTMPVAIQQTGPGKYEGRFDASQTGGYILTAAQTAIPGGKPQLTRAGFSLAYPPEYQATEPNLPLLQQIAQTTGGMMLQTPAQVFRPSTLPGKSVRDLWPDLLLAAALLFVLDIAVRRLALPIGEILAGAAVFSRRMVPIGQRRTVRVAQQAQSIARLSAVKRSSLNEQPQEQGIKASEEKEPTMVGAERKKAEKTVLDQPSSTAQRLLDAKRKREGR